MNCQIAVYGLTEERLALLNATISDAYTLQSTETITDLLVADAACCIINAEALDEQGVSILQNYYIDAGEYATEQIIWIGGAPPCKAFPCYGSFGEMLEELDSILQTAKNQYDIHAMYCGNYALMPAKFIADSLEQDVHCALHRKYGDDPAPEIMKRMRQEWTALLEIDAVPELAAVYELTLWLKKNNHPYWLEGNAPSGFVPYLLGITRVNPLPTELGGQNLVWQEFCSYGRAPLYEIHLSEGLKPRIIEWLKDHWLSKVNHFEWKVLQPYEPRFIRRGNMYFHFDLDDDSAPKNGEMPTLCREDIFFYLKKHGFVDKDAFKGMNSVRKGRGFSVITEEMRTAEDNWILEECENVPWLPSKAIMLEYLCFTKEALIGAEILDR